jgi:hypothetical protein
MVGTFQDKPLLVLALLKDAWATTLIDEGGPGMGVIEAYSNRWGVRRLSPHVKTVWCELLMPPIRQGGPGR